MKKLDKPNNTKDYESYLEMWRQAQPTEQDMKIGYRVFKDVKIFLKNTDYVKDRIQEIRQNSKNMMSYGSIKFIISTLLFILFVIVGFFDAFYDGEDFYKSFYNSTYTILDVLIMFAGAFFCLSIILFQFKWWIIKFYFLQIDELRKRLKLRKENKLKISYKIVILY